MTSIPAFYAHRLGRDVGPDSSRAALRATLAGSVDGVETDVCLTADGRLALLHDPRTQSCTTARGWARQTPWSELRTARLLDRDGAPTGETPMLLAGATGVIGVRLLPLLHAAGHDVAGMTRSPAKAARLRALGAEPVVCDVFDLDALRDAVASFRSDTFF